MTDPRPTPEEAVAELNRALREAFEPLFQPIRQWLDAHTPADATNAPRRHPLARILGWLTR